ncbi:UDP-GalNAc:beta-1,3-N-acetylgalactosaminyltransferase 2-like isoform X1 [Mya arenaria]|uniref:UDP-GalNAc:beta-1, 3-N-acetylgalactosaminyltransferase 2-like isoform X1 n=1 Tax=Mya arenaria TaxID=6604 RepID=UPI0022E3C4CC|nr:UDP-GalNAc:beta-1,3-N-acetylgalactosaminyltransferase 2-like isoform X1 [Mya arenaria]
MDRNVLNGISFVALLTALILYNWRANVGVRSTKSLVIGIMSARNHFEQREAARKTWLTSRIKNETLLERFSVKFIIGDTGCNVHPQNRKDMYSCSRMLFEERNQYSDLLLLTTTPSFGGEIGYTWNISFNVHHPVIVKRLGIHRSVIPATESVTVCLYDYFREEIVSSATFTSTDSGILASSYWYHSIEPMLLPKDFQGSLKILGKFDIPQMQGNETSINNSAGTVTVSYLDLNGFKVDSLPSLVLPSWIMTISEIDAFKSRLLNQDQLDKIQIAKEKEIKEKLDLEAASNKDIVFVNSIDVYRNLPEKVLQFHKWVHWQEPAAFIMKTDDDCFVDVEAIMGMLDHLKRNENIWLGNFRHDWYVERYGKWAEPVYRSLEYPAFACGSGNIVSQDISAWLGGNMDYLHRYQGEDTSMGIWLSAIGPKYHMDTRFMCDKTCRSDAFVIPELTPEEITNFWNNKQSCQNICGCE